MGAVSSYYGIPTQFQRSPDRIKLVERFYYGAFGETGYRLYGAYKYTGLQGNRLSDDTFIFPSLQRGANRKLLKEARDSVDILAKEFCKL